MKPQAILTFDLEFWYNSKFLQKYLPTNVKQTNNSIKKQIDLLLNLLNQYNQKATFFILGQLAEKYPIIVKQIAKNGHEIASHGYSHKTLEELTPADFEKEIKLSKHILKNIIGQEPRGFRAPNFSLNKKTSWALKILKENNWQYDSSIHPLNFYKPDNQLKEIPASLGGIYFRILPFGLYHFLIKHFSKNKIPVLYFHPYELFNFTPQIKEAPWLKRKIKYWGTKSAWHKFVKLIEKFDFISIEQYLYENPSD